LILEHLLIIRDLILIIGLTAFYCVWTSGHLVKKVAAWAVFQMSIILLWLTSSYPYHGRWNTLPDVVAFLIGVFSLGIGGIMLIFALGVLRRHDSWDIKKSDSKRSA
jgi:multisubunit Na+/H+ antiporter MnhC subunit